MPQADIMQRLWANLRPKDDSGKRTFRKGVYGRKIIAEVTIRGVEHGYHATKGYRRRRVEVA